MSLDEIASAAPLAVYLICINVLAQVVEIEARMTISNDMRGANRARATKENATARKLLVLRQLKNDAIGLSV